MADGKRALRVVTASLAGSGEVMRITAQFRGAKDAHLNILFDDETGDLLAVTAADELNIWRTGAPAGIGSRYLAPPKAKRFGLVGSGRQARGQLLAVRRAVPSLESARVFSPTEDHRQAFAQRMSSWLGLEVNAVDTAKEAVEGAEIVSLATSCNSPVIEPDWIRSGALVVSITSGQLPEQLIARSRVFATWAAEVVGGASPREPYAAMVARGKWSEEKIEAELGALILGNATGRESKSEIIILESIGMPAWDAAAAAWIYRWAVDNRAGTSFSLE